MRRIPVALAVIGVMIFATTPNNANGAVANRYKSCSYPKGNPGAYKPNAKSWDAQGFSNAVRGIDISVWQHPNNAAIDFEKLKSEQDLEFVIIKASDGGVKGNENAKKWFAKDSAAAKAQGLIVGAYHYALPGNLNRNTINDAKLQAARAVEQAGGAKKGDLPLTLDMEELPCGWTINRLAKWTTAFLIEAERLTGRTPMIYANGTFIQRLEDAGATDLAKYPLWLAKWGPKLGTVPNEKRIWKGNWSIWQFTADGKIAGVPSGTTDLNVFNGTYEEFAAFANN